MPAKVAAVGAFGSRTVNTGGGRAKAEGKDVGSRCSRCLGASAA